MRTSALADGERVPPPGDVAGRRAAEGAGLAGYPLHPFLFAAGSVLSLYVTNLSETAFADVAAPLAGALAFALALFLGFGTVLRGFGPRAAILASIVLVIALHHENLFWWLNDWIGGAMSWPASLWFMLAFMLAGLAAVWLAPVRLTLPNAILNGVAFVLFIVPAWKAASYEWRDFAYRTPTEIAAIGPGGSGSGPIGSAFAAPTAHAGLPDIYFFIFDRYGSQATLATEFNFDNQPFIDFLREKGFYVADEARANYLKTAPSLASTFHMDYINFLRNVTRNEPNEWRPMYEMLDDHRVARFLKEKGYTFIQSGSWWGPTQHNSFADENHSFGVGEFEWLYLRETMLPHLLDAAFPGSPAARSLRPENGQCRRVPLQIEEAKKAAERDEPTFFFAHLLLPHEPFVFKPDGSCREWEEIRRVDFNEGYVAQVSYANSLIEDFVTTALSRPGPKPIIIIQADEGPFPKRYRTGNRSWRDASKAEIQMKTGVLSAFYFPDGDYRMLRPDITSVNTFRLLFDKYFDAGLPLLPERIWGYPNYPDFYEFYDITDIGGAHAG
jgi:hypothetical protein